MKSLFVPPGGAASGLTARTALEHFCFHLQRGCPLFILRHNAAPGCLAAYRLAQKSGSRQGGGRTALPAALAGNNRRFYR